jgi:manganese transport protein
MATDLAEFLGATLGLNLLFGFPLLWGALVTAVATYAILVLEGRGFRPVEAVITSFVGILAASYILETLFARPDWGRVLGGSTTPWLGNPGAVLIAVGVVGATVMPHALYLHSALTAERIPARGESDRRRILRWSNREVWIALSIAALINLAMMYMAAAVFYPTHSGVADISTAYRTVIPLLGKGAAYVFLLSLIAAGLSSSAVGTMAGQVIMQGFVGFRIPLWARRLATMVPTVGVIAWGVNPTEALVVSQVILSLVLPVPMVALVFFTGNRRLMGALANRPPTQVVAVATAALIAALNLLLLAFILHVPIPFLAS